jgi:hypothetical protein
VKVPYVFFHRVRPTWEPRDQIYFLTTTSPGAKGAADLIANAEIAAGIDPIGLQNYPGLHDLFRDGDPTAETNPQSVDFYSPDTFNFTVLDVSPSGKTLTVRSVGMNSTAQNAGIEAANGPPAHNIFSFQIDGFESLQSSTQAIRDELNDALGVQQTIRTSTGSRTPSESWTMRLTLTSGCPIVTILYVLKGTGYLTGIRMRSKN